jgi:glucose dehydrogenase
VIRRSVVRLTASLVCASAAACEIADAPPFVSERALATAATQDSLWLSYGRDLGNTRFAPSARLTRESLHLLHPQWEHRRDWQQGVIHSTPLAFGGMLFYTGYGNIVLAVDARTGRERWRHQYVPDASVYPALCCGAVNRGLAVHDSTLYLATIDARLVALDVRSGAVRWRREVAPLGQGYSMTLAPLVDGHVVVGVSGGEFGVRGFVDAYDARTGERRWRFWTVPSPEQGGWWGSWATTTIGGSPLPRDIAREQADSARYADAWQHGGGGVWTTPAYDTATGLLFFGTGNPSAVDPSSGRIVWSRRTPGPQFGGGVLVTGADLVFFADQVGELHALDARTGDALWKVQTNQYVSAAPVLYTIEGRDYLALPTMGELIVYSP